MEKFASVTFRALSVLRRITPNSRNLLIPIAVCSALTLVMVFFVSAGQMMHFPTHSKYLDLLADGFLAGDTHIPVAPRPELLRVRNPYSHQHSNLWFLDATFYKGKYYLYWGPLSGVVVAAGKVLLGVASIPDQYVTFFYAVLRMVFVALLLVSFHRYCYPEQPSWPAWLGLGLLVLAMPGPYLLGHAAIYEAAILGGQCFLAAGFYFGFLAMGARAARCRRLLVLAGTMWTLAYMSRLSLAPATGALCALTAILAAPNLSDRRREGALRALVCVGLPALLGLVVLAWYNYVRFESPLEFGQNYTFTYPMEKNMAPEFVPVNLYRYLFRPPEFLSQFPFISVPWNRGNLLPTFLTLPRGYIPKEPVAGALYLMPFLILCLPALSLLAREKHRAPLSDTTSPPENSARQWLVTSSALALVVGFSPIILFYCSTMRYFGDLSTAGVILTAVGTWVLLEKGDRKPAIRGFTVTISVVLGLYSALVGFFLWTDSYFDFLRRFNPDLYHLLSGWWNGVP